MSTPYPRRLVRKDSIGRWREPNWCVACGTGYGLPRPACELGACLACGSVVCHNGLRGECPVCLIGLLSSIRTCPRKCSVCQAPAILNGRARRPLCVAHAATRIYQNAVARKAWREGRPGLTALQYVRENVTCYRKDFVEVGDLPVPEWCERISQEALARLL